MKNDTDLFMENLSLLLSSSMPMSDALTSLGEESRTRRMRKLAFALAEEIKNGSNLSAAFEKAKIFPGRYIALVKLGEQTGSLAGNLKLIVANQRRERQFQSKIKNALLYPAAVLCVTGGVAILTMWYTFPKLVQVFTSLGTTIPASTQAIIDVGNFLKLYGTIVVPAVFLAAVLIIYVFFFWKRTRIMGEHIMFVVPVVRGVVQSIELSRMGYALGSLVSAGMDIPQALTYLQESTPLIMYRRLYATLQKKIYEGVSLSNGILSYPHHKKLIPGHVVQLISASEKSGTLAETLQTIGESYQEKSDSVAKNVGAILEPVIILVVGVAVAAVAISIISPIYGLIGQIGQ